MVDRLLFLLDDMGQVVFAAYTLGLDAGGVAQPAHAHQHLVVLLKNAAVRSQFKCLFYNRG